MQKYSKILLKKKMMCAHQNYHIKNEAEAAISTSTVDDMTSRDFHGDIQAHIGIIGQLIRDKPHCDLYRNTILYNKHLFKGRTVLNLGCGVGLLALFAAQAEAACVYAVDDSNAVDYARRVVKANKYEHVVKLFKTSIKHLELPVAQVDIILCDWCGYSLLFESLCADVIYARDKWLKPNGIILPDMAKLYLGGFEDERHKYQRFDWWLDVYGFNMKSLRVCALQEPCYKQLLRKQVLSTVYPVYTLNLNEAKLQDLKFRSKFLLHFNVSGNMDGVFTYFDVSFSKSHTPAYISTAPTEPCTRWLQTLYFFDQPVHVKKGAALCGGFELFSLENGNLHNMQAGLELLSGDPSEYMHLEVAMCWRLKPLHMSKANVNQTEQSDKLIVVNHNGTNSEDTKKAVKIKNEVVNDNNNNKQNNAVNLNTAFPHNKRQNRGHRTQASAKSNPQLRNSTTALPDAGMPTQKNRQRGRYFKKSKN